MEENNVQTTIPPQDFIFAIDGIEVLRIGTEGKALYRGQPLSQDFSEIHRGLCEWLERTRQEGLEAASLRLQVRDLEAQLLASPQYYPQDLLDQNKELREEIMVLQQRLADKVWQVKPSPLSEEEKQPLDDGDESFSTAALQAKQLAEGFEGEPLTRFTPELACPCGAIFPYDDEQQIVYCPRCTAGFEKEGPRG